MEENDTAQMWEYAVTTKWEIKGFVAWMNNQGASGWELIHIIDLEAAGQESYYRMFWKRPWRGTMAEINEKG